MKEIEIDDPSSLPIHPAAELFPMLTQPELEELAADILAHGLTFPVVVHEGQLIDGRNRLKACELAGVRPTFAEWEGTTSVVDFVFTSNLHRRHLSPSQLGLLIARKMVLRAAETTPRLGIRAITPEADPGSAREKAAEQAHIGVATVHRAQIVLQKGVPELLAKVAAGDVRVSAAAEIATLPPEEQREVVRGSRETEKAKELRAKRTAAAPREPAAVAAPAPVAAAGSAPSPTPSPTPGCDEADFGPPPEEDPIRVARAAPIAIPEFRRNHRRGDTAKDEVPALNLIVEATRSSLYAWRFLMIEWEEDQRWDMDFARKEGAQVSRLLGQALAHLELVAEIAAGKKPVPPRGDA